MALNALLNLILKQFIMTLNINKLRTPEIALISVVEEDSVRRYQTAKKGRHTDHLFDKAWNADYALNSIELGLWNYDLAFNVLKICKRCMKLIGISKKNNMILSDFIALVPDERAPEIFHAVKKAWDQGTPFHILFPVKPIAKQTTVVQNYRS
jgi:hypothetical protein